MKKIIIAQFIILAIGTLFAFINFFLELMAWVNKKGCTTGCATPGINPFLTPCFYGALFFGASFVLSCILMKKNK